MPIINPLTLPSTVNTVTAENQNQGSVTALSGGRYVVVWAGPITGTTAATWVSADIRMQIFNADGTPSGGEVVVNTMTTDAQIWPQATVLADGNFIVTWMDGLGRYGGTTPTPVTLSGQEFTQAGIAVGGEFTIAAGSPVHLPAIAALADGGFMAFWTQGFAPIGIMGARFDANNVRVGEAFTVDDTLVPGSRVPRAVTLQNGNVVVSYLENSDQPYGYSFRIYAPDGTPITPSTFAGPATSSALRVVGAIPTALPDGGFGVLEYRAPADGSYEFWFRRYDADGQLQTTTPAVNPDVRLLTFGINSASYISVAVDVAADGSLVVAWSIGNENYTEVYTQGFNAGGTRYGEMHTVSEVGRHSNVGIERLSTGDYVVIWNEQSGATIGYDIRHQIFDWTPSPSILSATDDYITSTTGGQIQWSDLFENDINSDGYTLSITGVSNVEGGTVTVHSDLRYIRVQSTGTDGVRFTYTLTDAAGRSDTANVIVRDDPSDAAILRGLESVSVTLLANDSLPSSMTDLSVTLSAPLTLQSNGRSAFVTVDALSVYPDYWTLPADQYFSVGYTYAVSNAAGEMYRSYLLVHMNGWAQIGGTGADTLVGTQSSDHLIGGAGAANTMQGLGGDDYYTVSAFGDSVLEEANGGTDTVRAALGSFVLPNHVENLTFIGTGSFVGIGNDANNVITGGASYDELYGYAGNDTLTEGVGSVADALIGGAGDDTYVVTVRYSSTMEAAGAGNDMVRTTFNIYGLQANIENLIYTDTANHQAGVGNDLHNTLTGNIGVDDLFGRAGNDTLIGGTGAANTLVGQEGNDIYVVQAVGDTVYELANEGTDLVQTALASFVLRPNVENLTYTGTATFTGIGSDEANVITGGGNADFLDGRGGNDVIYGGSGNDELFGGAGADQFRYTGNETGVDRIYDFAAGVDRILLDTAIPHTATFAFRSGAGVVANSAVTTFLYDPTTGEVRVDLDGTGTVAPVLIAVLNTGLTLSAADFGFYGP